MPIHFCCWVFSKCLYMIGLFLFMFVVSINIKVYKSSSHLFYFLLVLNQYYTLFSLNYKTSHLLAQIVVKIKLLAQIRDLYLNSIQNGDQLLLTSRLSLTSCHFVYAWKRHYCFSFNIPFEKRCLSKICYKIPDWTELDDFKTWTGRHLGLVELENLCRSFFPQNLENKAWLERVQHFIFLIYPATPKFQENISIFWCTKNDLHWSYKHTQDLKYVFVQKLSCGR